MIYPILAPEKRKDKHSNGLSDPRLTTPKLKYVWGPFAQDDSELMLRIT